MQAARGASLTPSDHTGAGPVDERSRPSRRRLLVLFASVAALGYTADLVTKVLAVSKLQPGVAVQVVGDLFTFYIARNPGAAFSTGTSYTVVLSCVAIVAAVAVVWVARRLGSTGWAIGLGFLLAGILGNLTDRLFREPAFLRGRVVDFLRFPHFPIFNVADVCINIAAVFVIVQALRGISVSGNREERKGRAVPDAPEAPGS